MDESTGSFPTINPPPEDRLTFGKSLDRVVIYLIAGLTTWLCISTMNLREQMAAALERNTATQDQLRVVHENLSRHDMAINQLRVDTARRFRGE